VLKKYRKIITVIVALIIIISPIGFATLWTSNSSTEKVATINQTSAPLAQQEVVVKPQENPEPQKEIKPKTETDAKYIFLVIGDGMGMTHLKIGDLYQKISTGDMTQEGIWETFPNKNIVTAGVESSRGGTMLATGMQTPAGQISWHDGIDYTTIMDIAKQNGLSTGVITQADLTDATPATFLSHDANRGKNQALANDIHTSNVDFIMGGGLSYMFNSINTPLKMSWTYKKVVSNAKVMDPYKNLTESGYAIYLGNEGIDQFNSSNTDEKAIYSVESGNLPFSYIRKNPENYERLKPLPELREMTQKAIDSLIHNENGFIMMVEQASIDDAGHQKNSSYIAAEMGVMNETLKTIMEFYNEHPDNTLIILTADHETGNHNFSEEKYALLNNVSSGLPWDKSSDDINSYLLDNFGSKAYEDIIDQTKSYIESDFFNSDFENKMYGSAHIVSRIQTSLGLKLRSDQHSLQPVPLYTIGFGAQAFLENDSIDDIPHTICDIMGFEDILGSKSN